MKQTGVLCAVFSLPGKYGIGDFGKCAYDFMDKLKKVGVDIWQMLPLNPVGYGNSPYQPYSSYAGETAYIDLDALYEEGLLKSRPRKRPEASHYIDYDAVHAYKEPYLRKAFANFTENEAYAEFIKQDWVRLYAIFRVLKKNNGGVSWNEWKEEDRKWIANKDEKAIEPFEEEIRFEMFLQFKFYEQWNKIRAYAKEKDLLLMGDIPFYVGQDSLDVWMDQDQFLLDPDGYPTHVAGVPPDYFSEIGQRWGNPIYDWDQMVSDGFAFWKKRLLGAAALYDIIRIDHFRAFDTYWKIPASCPTAIEGEWIEAPGQQFFDEFLPEFKGAKIIAEDLGEMRPEVYLLRDRYDFPGMDVLQFTLFDPKFKVKDAMICYTGTHDNEMVRSWFEALTIKERKLALAKIHASARLSGEEIGRKFAEYCYHFRTDISIVPVQDILGLTNEARVNTPGTVSNDNWSWKMTEFGDLFKILKEIL